QGRLKEPFPHSIFKDVHEVTVARRIELLVRVGGANVMECGVGHNNKSITEPPCSRSLTPLLLSVDVREIPPPIKALPAAWPWRRAVKLPAETSGTRGYGIPARR